MRITGGLSIVLGLFLTTPSFSGPVKYETWGRGLITDLGHDDQSNSDEHFATYILPTMNGHRYHRSAQTEICKQRYKGQTTEIYRHVSDQSRRLVSIEKGLLKIVSRSYATYVTKIVCRQPDPAQARAFASQAVENYYKGSFVNPKDLQELLGRNPSLWDDAALKEGFNKILSIGQPAPEPEIALGPQDEPQYGTLIDFEN